MCLNTELFNIESEDSYHEPPVRKTEKCDSFLTRSGIFRETVDTEKSNAKSKNYDGSCQAISEIAKLREEVKKLSMSVKHLSASKDRSISNIHHR